MEIGIPVLNLIIDATGYGIHRWDTCTILLKNYYIWVVSTRQKNPLRTNYGIALRDYHEVGLPEWRFDPVKLQ